jgi:hypothetical protein
MITTSHVLKPKIMKKFLIISFLFSLFTSLTSNACGPMAPIHNYYMFNVYPHIGNDLYGDQLSDFWKSYTGENRTNEQIRKEFYQTPSEYYFSDNCGRIFATAKRKQDHEMMAYIRHLINYNKICDQLKETWDYPTKQQLAARRTTLLNMQRATKAYRGKRLSQQYALLYMRANMLLGAYNINTSYWTGVASKFSKSVYRDMMQGIYANALLHKGMWRQACDIYASQGDWNSIGWAMRKYRNQAGISNIYAVDPNSPTLNYLVQDFVNSAQETIDDTDNKEWITEVGMTPVYKKDIMAFTAFANKVAVSGKVNNPCLWKSATAMLNYLIGNKQEASADIDKAMTMAGDEKTKDNARCIRLLISTDENQLDSKYTSYLATEFKWLFSKRTDGQDYYSNVMNRVVYQKLAPKYLAAGRPEVSTALLCMMNEIDGIYSEENENQHSPSFNWNKKEDYQMNGDYFQTEYFNRLDSMKADDMVKYFHYLQSSPDDGMERLILSKAYKNADFYNDFIGTKYIAEGRFGDAIPYLKQVPLSYLSHQNICYYMAHRDFTKDRWFTHQKFGEDVQTDGYNLAVLKENPKVKFCEEMLRLQSQYTLAGDDNSRRQAAYTLASRYYQASCYGDCWYLSHYAQSCMDTARTMELDFAQKALEYLKDSKMSTDLQMMQKSLYANAYVSNRLLPWNSIFDDRPVSALIKSRPETYLAYNELSDFIRQNQPQDRYITKCDVLKKFMSSAY